MRTVSRVLVVLLLLGSADVLAAQIPPDATWKTLDTEHFRVHFTPEVEPVARRAAAYAEDAYALLSEQFLPPPGGRIDLVLANNADVANGFATVFPRPRVYVYLHPPADEPSLAFTEDWLKLLITHELTHVFHLDYAGGLWKPLRSVFGRSPLLFPQLYTPSWVVEGLATYYESLLTEGGRVRGTEQEMVLRTAILEDAFFDIDRATGSPVAWPGGRTRYIYGSLFLAHLARERGAAGVPGFVQRVGKQIVPYRVESAARKAFDVSFSRAWQEWQDSLRQEYTALADSLLALGLTEPELLTDAGRWAMHPRYSPDGERIAYASATARERMVVRLILPDGSQRSLAERTMLGPAAWLPREATLPGDTAAALVTSQLEFVDPYRIYADLYALGLDGSERELTEGARIWEPDPHPDGRRVVAVSEAPATNALVIYDLESGAMRPLREPEPAVHWSLPRWSPRGDRIAVERWERGGFPDIAVLDSAGSIVRQLTRDRAVESAPGWSPDGRYVVFSSDRTGIANLYAYDLETDRLWQVTSLLTGAFHPDVSPDGQWIAFSFYRSDGYVIARIPWDTATWRPAPPLAPRFAAPAAAVEPTDTMIGGPVRPYSPWRSLRPAALAVSFDGGTELGLGFGLGTSGIDVVQRHLYAAGAQLYPEELRIEGGAGYQYRGWGNPVLGLGAFQDWSVFREGVGVILPSGDTVGATVLEREAEGSAALSFLHRRWNSSWWFDVGGDLRQRERVWDNPALGEIPDLRLPEFPLDLGAAFLAGFSTIRQYSFSISPEEGFRGTASVEGRRYLEPFAGEEDPRGYLRLLGRGQGYYPIDLGGFARHVTALRVTAGVESGSISPGFSLGGESGGGVVLPLGSGIGGTSRSFPLRGYPAGVQVGTRVVSASAEYRVPLLLVERGYRTLPIFLDRVSLAGFADGGAAWCDDACSQRFQRGATTPEPLYSVGAELNVGVHVLYFLNLLLRGGVAVPLSPVAQFGGEAARPDPEFYLLIGRSF